MYDWQINNVRLALIGLISDFGLEIVKQEEPIPSTLNTPDSPIKNTVSETLNTD